MTAEDSPESESSEEDGCHRMVVMGGSARVVCPEDLPSEYKYCPYCGEELPEDVEVKEPW